jgi:hypothetical protein
LKRSIWKDGLKIDRVHLRFSVHQRGKQTTAARRWTSRWRRRCGASSSTTFRAWNRASRGCRRRQRSEWRRSSREWCCVSMREERTGGHGHQFYGLKGRVRHAQ